MTSSKLMEEVKLFFRSTINVYHRYIVFCGSEKTCK